MLGEMGLTPTALVTAGIDLDLFQCLVAPHLRAPVVGFAARSGKIKAIPVMLRACEILHGRRPDISFVSFGHGYSDPMPNFVTHLGPLSPTDLRDFYNKCMIFALSSDYEGWGLPAAEAMACGVALVTTANGGVEDFATDRANALIVPRQDPEALAGAIAELLDDTELRLSLIEKSLLTAQELGLAAAIDRLDGALRKSILTT
jgi:glycosyltransferase involved in cell wall biosynthesis